MKKIFLSLLLITVSFNVFSQEQQPILKNGDMEIWRDNKDLPNSWNSYHTILREGIFSRSTDARSGKYAIQLNFEPKREHDNRRFFTYPMKMEQGSYKVILHFKGNAEIRFITLTKKGGESGGKDSDTNIVGSPSIGEVSASEWTSYTVDFDVKNAADYQMFICVNSAEGFLIDDVSMDIIKN